MIKIICSLMLMIGVSVGGVYAYEHTRDLDSIVKYVGVVPARDAVHDASNRIEYYSISTGSGDVVKYARWLDTVYCDGMGDQIVAQADNVATQHTFPTNRITSEIESLFKTKQLVKLRRLLRESPNYNSWSINNISNPPPVTTTCRTEHHITVTTPILGIKRVIVADGIPFTFIVRD